MSIHIYRQVLGSVSVSIASLLWGCAIAWPAIALPQLRNGGDGGSNSSASVDADSLDVDDYTASWIGSSMPVGGTIGGLLTGSCIDLFGRKRFMLVLYLTSAIGWSLVSWAPSIAVLCLGRGITGACSAGAAAGPAYIAEISNKKIRGALGSFISLLVSIGLLYMLVIGSLTKPWLSAVASIPWCLTGFLLMLVLPESPHHLFQKGKVDEAKEIVQWFHGCENFENEFLEITRQKKLAKNEANEESLLKIPKEFETATKKKTDISTSDWDGYSFRMLAVVCCVMLFTRLSGIPVISYYTVDIFASASTTMDPNLAAIIGGVAELVGGAISLPLTDIAGRKILLVVSGLIMGSSMGVLSFMFYLQENEIGTGTSLVSTVTVSSVVFFYLGFAIGFAPIPMVLLGEVFSQRTKGLATTISITILWIFSFVVSKLFFDFQDKFGNSGTFIWFAGFNFVAAVFVVNFVPETKGKTFSEIHAKYKPQKSKLEENELNSNPLIDDV